MSYLYSRHHFCLRVNNPFVTLKQVYIVEAEQWVVNCFSLFAIKKLLKSVNPWLYSEAENRYFVLK